MFAFFLTPIGKLAGIGLIALMLVGGFFSWLHFHDKAILAGYVLLSEKTALQAQLDEQTRQVNAGNLAIAEYQERLRAIKEQEAAQDAVDIEKDKVYAKELEATGRAWRLEQRDLDELLKP
jgi:hypothetical protein